MKRRTLALLLTAALTVTSVEGTAIMASAADFTSEAAVESIPDSDVESGSETEIFSEQEGEIASEEIGITDGETQEEEDAEDEISIFDESDDGADEEEIEITDGEASEVTDNEESAFTDEESAGADIEVFAGEDESTPVPTGIEVMKSEISLYEDFESSEGYGIEDILKLNYSDGTASEPLLVYLGDQVVRDKDRNTVNGITAELVYADPDKAEESIVWSGGSYRYLLPGSYKYIFTWTPEDEAKEPVSVETSINVIAFAAVFDKLPQLKEGRQKVVSDGEMFFGFVPEVSGTYQFNTNRGFSYVINELVDGKLSEDYQTMQGYSDSAVLEAGKKYIVYISGATDSRGEILTIDRVPLVKSVEIASWSPENLTFTEGDDVSFYYLDARLNTDKGSETVRIYGYGGLYGKTIDAYGNTVGYSLFKIENDEFIGLNFANKDSLPAGEYAFRVYYNKGNMTAGSEPDFIAENYVPVHIKSVQDQTKDSVLDTEKDLTVKVENSRAVYSFTPEATGRYELSTSTFVEGVLKDGDGEVIEKQRRHERSMYVSLEKDTTYYMYMTVQSSLCTQVQVSAEKLALPTEITVSLKKISYDAEMTQLWELQPKFTVKYDDGTSETATEDSSISGWGLGYYLENPQDKSDVIYNHMDYIPAGTWICAPELYTNERDEEILKDVLQVNTYGPEITAESQKIDISKLDAITVDNPVSVPETKQTFFRVDAEAGHNYKLETPDGVTAKLYEWNEQDGLKNIDAGYYSVYFETGKTYLYEITAYHESKIILKKTSGGVPGQQYFEETYPLKDGFRQTIQMPEDKVSPATLEFTFTPEEDASYCFQIESNLEAHMWLYEGEGNNKEFVYGDASDGDLKVSY